MENLWKLMPLLLIFGAFIVCMLLIDRKSLNIKSKTVGDGQHGSASFATPKEIDAAFQRVRYEPQVWRRKPPCDLPPRHYHWMQYDEVRKEENSHSNRGERRCSCTDDRCCRCRQDSQVFISKSGILLCVRYEFCHD